VTRNDTYDPRFLDGVRYFNLRDFFEAHESWEELWVDYQGPLRRFYQGLIQVAVCLHHFGNGNMHGARKLYYSSVAYLEKYGAHQDGVNLVQLLAELKACCQSVIDQDEPLTRVPIQPDLIPEIHLDPPPTAGTGSDAATPGG
jgi:predicted metal-dependent hydrolase